MKGPKNELRILDPLNDKFKITIKEKGWNHGEAPMGMKAS